MANHKTIYYIEDPNTVNIDSNIPNAIVSYEDMNIYAELVAERRGRSVLNYGQGISTDDKITISFIGYNQNESKEGELRDPNHLNFTTNYYDGSVSENKKQFESFGISNIKISINSSYVPQVSITFVDIRGLSFFNQENSPYRMLFDFPPPIFRLTIKGYYGKALQYDLHLIKYTTEFKSENGNFVIDAQFIAMTFAPLSDILLRYITNLPLINDISVSKPNEPPKNTNDFIIKLRTLYSSKDKQIENFPETKKHDAIVNDIAKVNDVINILANYNGNNSILKKYAPIMFVAQEKIYPDLYPTLVQLNSLFDYNKWVNELNASQEVSSIDNRLYIGYIINSKYISDSSITTSNSDMASSLTSILNSYGSEMNKSIEGLGISNANITEANTIELKYVDSHVTYLAIDITNFYVTLFRKKIEDSDKERLIATKINEKIDAVIIGMLGIKPTIYKVFKLILDDVDSFFNILRDTSNEAERLHQQNLSKIAGYLGDNDGKNATYVYSFPLIMKNELSGNVMKKERTSPKEMCNTLSITFPELTLVNDFIDTFYKQEKIRETYDMRGQTNPNGTYKWIPITPLDSKLAISNINSPYLNLDLSDVNKQSEIAKVLLNRFYVLSQYVIPNKFYNKETSEYYADLYGKSEATNLILNIVDSNSARLLESFANRYRNRINDFFSDIQNSKNNLSVYNYLSVNPDKIDINGNEVYIDKANDNYIGVILYDFPISDQVIPEDESNPLFKFINDSKKSWWKLFDDKLPKESIEFSEENLMHIRDFNENNKIEKGGVNIATRFLGNKPIYQRKFAYLSNKGNRGFSTEPDKESKNFANSIEVLAKSLANNPENIYNQLNNFDDLSALLILSFFGDALSPFNYYPNNLCTNIFQAPAIIEVPYFIPAYIGCVLKCSEKDIWDSQIIPFLTKNCYYSGADYIAADSYDFKNYLSINDKKIFIDAYTNFTGNTNATNGFTKLKKAIQDVINAAKKSKKEEEYEDIIDGSYFNSIIQPLLIRTHLLVNDENAFNYVARGNEIYESLFTVNNNNSIKKEVNISFFNKFFTNLYGLAGNKIDELTNNEIKWRKLKGDDDLINQTYYSFKTINDKWLGGQKKSNGYPFNDKTGHLIDLFAFVDRAMNPIGDTAINPEILLDLFEDPNVSVFSVLSQLLSMNHFEFFPLQNFVVHETGTFEDSFRINPTVTEIGRAAFICMYIGGSSNYPSNISGNGFENDGIIDLFTTDLPDFDEAPQNINDDRVKENNSTNFDYKQVRAFKVLFGQQNQSMFKDIKIEGKEYPETNESIQILSRLAGDNELKAPTPKGQNLYNVYENRAYSATVTSLGNAMIQPTQYFQLDNVPLFNGAYMILSVEHEIKPNFMTTSFTGTKILKYPIPRVTNTAVATGLGYNISSIGDNEYLNKNSNNISNVTMKISAKPNPYTLPSGLNAVGALYNYYKIAINAPIDPYEVTSVTGLYGEQRADHIHEGIDFAAPKGKSIWAVKDGTLFMRDNPGGYGKYIYINHDDNTYSVYGHLSSYAFDASENKRRIKAKEVIGFCGSDGRSTGSHLHFEYGEGQFDNKPKPLDPRPYLEISMRYVWQNLLK